MSHSLSKETITTVKTTIPFLQENGVKLTEHFYKRLFAGNPEVKAFFNTSNQESGAQQRALGGAICAFAQNIETPENLAEAVSLIGHKHASLGVKAEHYPIVGKHLLGSIDDLLNPAPAEILTAWGEAYEFLANVLINAEQDIYDVQKNQEGGWNGFREMKVFKKEEESVGICSFYLRPKDQGALPAFQSGQYITVRIPTEDGSTTMRNYSLSGSAQWNYYRISVKKELPQHADTPAGYVSNYLHHQIAVGDSLELGPPCGDFYLQEHSSDTPLLLISGGIGITPMLSMLHSLEEQKATFLHGAINGETHAFRQEVTDLVKEKKSRTLHFRYSSPTQEDEKKKLHHSSGLFTQDFLTPFLTAETEVYFCGPKLMMQHLSKILKDLQHPEKQIHYEFFGPKDDLEISS